MTESMSAPAGVCFRTGECGRTVARKSHSAPSREDGARRVLGVGEREQPEAPVRLDDMPQLDGPGVSEADDRRGMKAHADREPFGEALTGRLRRSGSTGDSRWPFPR